MRRILAISGLLAMAAAAGVADQKNAHAPAASPPPAPPPQRKAAAAPEHRAPGQAPHTPNAAQLNVPRPPAAGAAHINNPLNAVVRFLQMGPGEQERLLKKGTPGQQEHLRQAIDRYNAMPAAQRELLVRQYQVLTALPPAQQALISREIAAFNNQLTEDRRRAVGAELIRLRGMDPAKRAARLGNVDFVANFSYREQEILRNLSENLPAEYPLKR